jgi:adenylate cyclase
MMDENRVKLLFGLSVVIGMVVLLLGAREFKMFERLELLAYDQFLVARLGDFPADERITFVGMSETDIARFGYPLGDGCMAEVISKLAAANATVIGVDIYRDSPVYQQNCAQFGDWNSLNSLVSETRNIVWISRYDDRGQSTLPPPSLRRKPQQVGLNNLDNDVDGVIRRGTLYWNLPDENGQLQAQYSFSSRVAFQFLQRQRLETPPQFKDETTFIYGNGSLGKIESTEGAYRYRSERGWKFMIDYRGGNRRIAPVSIGDLIDGNVSADTFAGKVVLVAVWAPTVPDYFNTPFNCTEDDAATGYCLDDTQVLRGPEIHGHTISQLIRIGLGESSEIRSVSDLEEYAWIFFWVVLGVMGGYSSRSLWLTALEVVVAAAFITGIAYFWFLRDLWLPVVPVVTGFLLSAGVAMAHNLGLERRQRGMLMSVFARHVSPRIAEAVWDQRESLLDGGRVKPQRLIVTVLFTDLQGFTTISENLEPDVLLEWLNEYMEAMTEVVFEFGGSIDKFIGDAIMAVFGVPVPKETDEEIARDAKRAVQCALAMNTRLDELNAVWAKQERPQLAMRIGVQTGPVVAGSLGGSARVDYTVLGDTVNTAARLESYDKSVQAPGMSARILIGEDTRNRVGDSIAAEAIGAVELKGKMRKIKVYLVQSQNQSMPEN